MLFAIKNCSLTNDLPKPIMRCLMDFLDDDPFPTRDTWIAQTEDDIDQSNSNTFFAFG